MSDAFGEVVEKLRRVTVQVNAHRKAAGPGVIWSRDGRIITNAHVVDGAGSSGGVEVELWDGRRLPGKIVNRDRRRDLADMQVEASGLPAATPGDSNALRVGELVIAVGNPLGFIGAASTGVVHRSENRSLGCQPDAAGSWKFRRTAGKCSRRGGWDQHHDRRRTRVRDSFSLPWRNS